MMHKRPELDTQNPPGQIVSHPTMGETKLGDIIDKVRRSEPLRKYWLTEEVLSRIMYLARTADNYAEEGKFDGYSDYRNRLRQFIIEAAGD